MRPKLDNLKIVPENTLVHCSNHFEGPNAFTNILDEGQKFKLAGLTPIYLCTNDFKVMEVTTKEKLKKLLH